MNRFRSFMIGFLSVSSSAILVKLILIIILTIFSGCNLRRENTFHAVGCDAVLEDFARKIKAGGIRSEYPFLVLCGDDSTIFVVNRDSTYSKVTYSRSKQDTRLKTIVQ